MPVKPPTSPVIGDAAEVAALKIWNDPDRRAEFAVGLLDVPDEVAALLDEWEAAR